MEEQLVNYIIHQADRGFPLTRECVRLTVVELVTNELSPEERKALPFRNGPGRGWMRAFFKRHPAPTEKTSEYLSSQRSEVPEASIREWFRLTAGLIELEKVSQVTKDPARFFNTDETAIWLNPKNGKFVAKRGRRLHRISENSDKENTTVLFNISAAGTHFSTSYCE